ncbi:MAG: PaaI family thioesterase [Candidatus Omnitrophica bacterium]|nr:PaaI family thioesterase [Candidatus Omnitrophota bacterium]
MSKARDFSLRDKFATYNSMEVVEVAQGFARARLDVKPQHHNGLGTVHGGVLFTLADLAFAAASNFGEDTVVGINASMSFFKAASQGVLLAEAREVTRSAKLVAYEAKVTNDSGDIIAVFQGTGYIKSNSRVQK